MQDTIRKLQEAFDEAELHDVWRGQNGDGKLVAIQFSPLAEAEAGR